MRIILLCLILSSIVEFTQAQSYPQFKPIDGNSVTIVNKKDVYQPLDSVYIKISKSDLTLSVQDAMGNEYVHLLSLNDFNFLAGGELGRHTILLSDKKGRIIDRASFYVDCKTQIDDENKYYHKMLSMLYWSMIKQYDENSFRIDGAFYPSYSGSLLNDVASLKGLKYFKTNIQSTLDMYSHYQREDGMMWDFVSSHLRGFADHWDNHFANDHYVMLVDSDNYQFRRTPYNADAEFWYIDGIYETWKMTGDDAWMTSRLDDASKAINYILTSPVRWSEKHQLIKRVYTIDFGSTLNDYDVNLIQGNPTAILKDKAAFGIMFGDNTEMAMACAHMAEMLEHADKKEEAEKMHKMAKDIQERINKLSWNGNFYTHFIPEDPKRKYDFDVATNEQVSLSNALSLNRMIDHEKCVKIIESYMKIKEQRPVTSPGEWYTVYPPFNKGFDKSAYAWEYINGGVTPVVAGELARSAFENGFEKYGIDIMHRIDSLASLTGQYLNGTYRGAMPDVPKGSFTTISLSNLANADIGLGNSIIPGWTDEKDNNLGNFPTGIQVFQNIPFDVTNPQTNQQRACIALSEYKKFQKSTCLELNRKATSIYLLHCVSRGPVAGTMIIHYQDSTTYTDIIGQDKIFEWWYPREADNYRGTPTFKIAWRGENKVTKNIGVGVYGFNNPYPDKEINHIEFVATNKPAKWMILGITLSDNEVFFMPSFLSAGFPNSWSSASMISAMVEGLAGVKEDGKTFSRVLLTPRWLYDSISKANVAIRYGASRGYVSYRYNYFKEQSRIILEFTGNAHRFEVRVPLPEGKEVDRIYINGRLAEAKTEKIEGSQYIKNVVEEPGVKTIIYYLK